MSGPKYSRARVDIARVNMLLKELEEKIEKAKCQEIKRNIETISNSIHDIIHSIDIKRHKNILAQAQAIIPDSHSVTSLKKQLESFELLGKEQFASVQESIESLIQLQSSLEEHKLKLKNLLSFMNTISIQIKSEYDDASANKKQSEFLCSDWYGIRDELIIKNPKLNEAYENLLRSIVSLKNYDNTKKSLDIILENHSFDDEYKIKQMTLRCQAAIVEDSSSQSILKMLELQAEALAISNNLGYPISVFPKELEKLELLVTDLKEKQKSVTLSGYISKSLSEVMTSMGYNIIGAEILENKSNLAEKSYYEYTNTSAINVSSSTNGSVMFEVVSKGSNKDLTDARKALVECDMKNFCPDYQQIKARLAQKGIILENEHLCEADKKYVRALNLKDASERRGKQSKRLMVNDD